LFFLPVFPYRSTHVLVCPVCNGTREIDRHEYEEIVRDLLPPDGNRALQSSGMDESAREQGGWPSQEDADTGRKPSSPDRDRYAGKNQTQRAYLEKLEAHERAIEEQKAKEALPTPGTRGEEPAQGEERYQAFQDAMQKQNAREKELTRWEMELEAREKAVIEKEKALKDKPGAGD